MNIYGYCRISTAKQSTDRQIRNIKAEYPTAHIVQEAYTGTSIFRPEWLKLYRILKSGDMVVFDSVSRMSRNAEEGFALYLLSLACPPLWFSLIITTVVDRHCLSSFLSIKKFLALKSVRDF